MTSNLNSLATLQSDIERAHRNMQLLVDPPGLRLIREIEQATLWYQQHENSIQRAIQDAQKFADWAQPAISSFQKQVALQQKMFDDLRSSPVVRLIEEARDRQQMFDRMVSQAANAALQFQRFTSSIQQLAIAPVDIATSFTHATSLLVDKWDSLGRPTASLLASIACAESQAIAQEAEIVEYPEVFDFEQIEVDERDDDAFRPTQNLYYVQRTELIYVARRNPEFLEDEAAIDGLGTMQYFACAQSVCNYVTQINRLCKAIGRAPVFKLTEQLAESLVALPNIVAVHRSHFGEFVDHLYFIVYEGAGKDNLRFLELLDDDDSEPVWTLKHLRNYFVRHDVEHGKAAAIAKKQKELGEHFNELIGKPLPRTRDDFTRAQLAFLQRVEAMLRVIYDRIEQQAKDAASEHGGTEE